MAFISPGIVKIHPLTGVAGAGGVIYDPEGKQESTYSWGLGIPTNNQAEAYTLFQGFSIAISLG